MRNRLLLSNNLVPARGGKWGRYFLAAIGFFVCLIMLFWGNIALASVKRQVNALIRQNVPNTHVGIMVMDLDTGKVFYRRLADEKFTPASNLKLFTAAATLIGLGPEYHYKTILSYEPKQLNAHILQGNVYLKFSGDPSLTSRDLGQMIAQLKAQGITQIDGNIIIDDSLFTRPDYLLGSTFEDLNWYYSAPVPAIIVNQNKVTLHLNPAKKLYNRAMVTPKEGMEFVTLTNRVKTVSYDQAEHHCQLLLNVNSRNHIELGGCWPIYGARSELNIAVKNPRAFTENILRKYLKSNHIIFNGKFLQGEAPLRSTSVEKIVHDSKPMKTLIKTLLKESNNLYATAFTKTLGVKYFHTGTIQEGVNAIQKLLANRFGMSFDDTELRDGVGSQYNLVSPQKISQLLYNIYHDKTIYPYFINALPRSRHRENTTLDNPDFKSLPPDVYAKTGRLHSTSALSGYMKTRHKRQIAFSFIVDDTRSFSQARMLQMQLCQYFSDVF
jgi:D-alanyl-D-alanine carboxypeptidase/D-alanyl-D-alanine-endopeptidase (penicillin-binding protein 4)